MYEIKTSNYISPKTVLIDGRTWTITVPGAGDELMLGQAKRRIEFLQKKVDAGTATDQDYDLFDNLENNMFSIFSRLFTDGTKENAEVKQWLDSTPMMVIYTIVEDIKKQAEHNGNQTEIS